MRAWGRAIIRPGGVISVEGESVGEEHPMINGKPGVVKIKINISFAENTYKNSYWQNYSICVAATASNKKIGHVITIYFGCSDTFVTAVWYNYFNCKIVDSKNWFISYKLDWDRLSNHSVFIMLFSLRTRSIMRFASKEWLYMWDSQRWYYFLPIDTGLPYRVNMYTVIRSILRALNNSLYPRDFCKLLNEASPLAWYETLPIWIEGYFWWNCSQVSAKVHHKREVNMIR